MSRWTLKPVNGSGTISSFIMISGTGTYPMRLSLRTCRMAGRLSCQSPSRPGSTPLTDSPANRSGPLLNDPFLRVMCPESGIHPQQPFPTRPAAFDRQGFSEDDLIDYTPALRAMALGMCRISDLAGPFLRLLRSGSSRRHPRLAESALIYWWRQLGALSVRPGNRDCLRPSRSQLQVLALARTILTSN